MRRPAQSSWLLLNATPQQKARCPLPPAPCSESPRTCDAQEALCVDMCRGRRCRGRQCHVRMWGGVRTQGSPRTWHGGAHLCSQPSESMVSRVTASL